MKIKLWGTRGSCPSPITPQRLQDRTKQLLIDFFDSGLSSKSQIDQFWDKLPFYKKGSFGGNTSCTEVSTGQGQIIIDCGSGIRELGYEMLKGPAGKGKSDIHIFITHFHWDHLIGLLFFTPIYIPGNQIHFHAVQPELESIVRLLFCKPRFPVPFESLGAKIHFHTLEPRKPVVYEDMTITPYQLDHPDPCWGFRVENNGKAYAHCVDTECTRVSRDQLGPDLPLYQNTDLMLFDAQYTLGEAINKIYWGHAAATFGLDIAMREGIKKVAFTHPDPAATDELIVEASEQTQHYYKSHLRQAKKAGLNLHEVEWLFVQEGMVFDL